MAKKMSGMYTALKEWSSYDSGAKIELSATKLSSALFGLVPIPGGVNPSTIVGGVAGDLARLSQIKDIRRKTRVAQEALVKISELFERESAAYTAIAIENSVTSKVVLQELIENELVNPWPILDKVPNSFGMKWASSGSAPPKDRETKCGFIKIGEWRANQSMKLAQDATQQVADALEKLSEVQAEYLAKKPVNLSSLSAALGRAKFYIEEIKKLRAEING